MGKERSWAAQAEAQGETFYPLAIEVGGAVNERFREFLVFVFSFAPGAFPLPWLRPATHPCGLCHSLRVADLPRRSVVYTRGTPFRLPSPNQALWVSG